MLYENLDPAIGIYETRPFIGELYGFTVLEPASNNDVELLKDKLPLDREGEPEWWLNAIIDECAWRYACVCGQWEDDSHDPVICDERLVELI